MAMDRADKMELLYAALGGDNAHKFERLLGLYPECRVTSSGDDRWLSVAASSGRLEVVKYLVGQGADVNKPTNSTDSVPAPEGPIVEAAGSGSVELVRFLLDCGAQVNHLISGRPRCYALSQASNRGHLDVVKLLIERGADVNAEWARMTALDMALDWGRDAVADYLVSVGGKTAEELRGATG